MHGGHLVDLIGDSEEIVHTHCQVVVQQDNIGTALLDIDVHRPSLLADVKQNKGSIIKRESIGTGNGYVLHLHADCVRAIRKAGHSLVITSDHRNIVVDGVREVGLGGPLKAVGRGGVRSVRGDSFGAESVHIVGGLLPRYFQAIGHFLVAELHVRGDGLEQHLAGGSGAAVHRHGGAHGGVQGESSSCDSVTAIPCVAVTVVGRNANISGLGSEASNLVGVVGQNRNRAESNRRGHDLAVTVISCLRQVRIVIPLHQELRDGCTTREGRRFPLNAQLGAGHDRDHNIPRSTGSGDSSADEIGGRTVAETDLLDRYTGRSDRSGADSQSADIGTKSSI